ncbi:hypothetical protein RCL1_006657 [Eukaryota sp. TZLM3-RCL]
MHAKTIVFLLLPLLALCIRFDLIRNSDQEFLDEFATDTFVMGTIGAPLSSDRDIPLTQVDFKVEDPRGFVVYEKIDLRGVSKFGFTTSYPGEYKFIISCKLLLEANFVAPRQVVFDYHLGHDAAALSELATSEQLKPMDLQMQQVQEYLKTVHNTQLYLHEVSSAALVANESTNARIPYFMFLIICIIVASSVAQAVILKRDLKRHKIA